MRQIPILESVVKELNPFERMIEKIKSPLKIVFVFAFCSNILMLITPLYSLQVLDRVIGSGNLNTLLMLSIIIGSCYLVYSLIQVARSFTLIKIGEWMDNNISPVLFGHSVASAAIKQTLGAGQVLRDFQTVKGFLTSTGINTLFDAPWTVAYVAAIFMINPYIGWLTVGGAIVICIFALLNAVATTKVLGESTEYSIRGLNQAEIATRNAEVIEAMGMMKNVSANWKKFNELALEKQSVASYRSGIISNISRYIRNIIQMMVTGIGAMVVVDSQGADMTTGGMIASSILVGRALAPFDNFIELWKSITGATKSYKRINDTFKNSSLREEAMQLSEVQGNLVIEDVYYAHQNSKPQNQQNPFLNFMAQPKYILKGISFSVTPGEVLAIIGHSASGKSTLAKIMVGVWKTTSGDVRLDGAEVYRWTREDFGKNVGYLPQGIELFSGTIRQNIARMDSEADPERVIKAAKIAGAHEIILRFSEGYDSDIGVAGSNLSGGQKQRIALARAFYGDPKLVVLDEPNANLDEAGEMALSNALMYAKSQSISVVVISHRPSVLSYADNIILLQDGSIVSSGKRDDVLTKIQNLNDGVIHIKK